MRATLPLLQNTDFPVIYRAKLTTLQVNLGYICNQQCLHCHVNAGPNRTESMARETIEHILNYLKNNKNIKILDITGGAPELHPDFRYLVTEARCLGITVQDRCNLTILTEDGQHDLAAFLAAQQVQIIASLPCYLAENVDKQRGKGTFNASLNGLKQLNALGYGINGSHLTLNLVYNPITAHLPPAQAALEHDYKQYLQQNYGIVFNQLLTLANMPIQRFGSWLISTGQFQDYMNLLRQAYSASNLEKVMCRTLISIDWQGYIYDCDFNQMLKLAANIPQLGTKRAHISELATLDLTGNPVTIADHCYGCTAGQGSSCGGALT